MQTSEEKRGSAVFSFDVNSLRSRLADVIKRHVSADTFRWLEEKASRINGGNTQDFMMAFGAAPRKTGKQPVVLSDAEKAEILRIRPNLAITHWTIDRLSRVWLLMHLDATKQDEYVRTIETMFPTAEMSEQVALYSSLPLLAYPALWRSRCAEGIRSNIADVLESIMCDNPFPAENLDEPAWNQLVLKAIFTEKPIHRIVGLDERANQQLANTLSDYAHERWAAHRAVHPMLWRCVARFINEKIFPDIRRIALSERASEREAAALACAQSAYAPARDLLEKNTELQAIVKSGMTWNDLAKKLEKNP
ncbi:EboA domain-containing protein [Fulvivirgaceae bacterium PWU4]|uniref:EboA domain-containing protein n=1 Tax=Chryseosolibacter histidini TaxID=2782349 RepID=A0AAP2DM17_9BACT|nr:EboA domain-containing protein [Chryseosolibacter histidini]MBT1698851.1 EboA domain-containing protein [Chryseosolibacter histidini]